MIFLVAMMPGLLLFSALPVSAQAAVVDQSTAQVAPETPRQQLGSAGRLPTLVSSEVTEAVDKSVERDPKRPKGALPLEERAGSTVSSEVKGLKDPPPVPGHKNAVKVDSLEAVSRGQEPWSAVQNPVGPSSGAVAVAAGVPTVSSLQVSPGTLSSGTWVTSTLEPTLSAVVSDPDSRAVGINIEVQHDPAVPSQGSGLIWSGNQFASQTTG
ncbi:hypothetical protein, partial [Nonomuraea sp. KM90]|uniref:hypothetical protein n=1 Tax=Nonomuraea sp. KM90 TaxID=3457428 RepID=UPI003FCCAB59